MSQTTINPDAPLATRINVFTVAPEGPGPLSLGVAIPLVARDGRLHCSHKVPHVTRPLRR